MNNDTSPTPRKRNPFIRTRKQSLQLYVSPDELAAWQAYARACGESVSGAIRRIGLELAGTSTRIDTQDGDTRKPDPCIAASAQVPPRRPRPKSGRRVAVVTAADLGIDPQETGDQVAVEDEVVVTRINVEEEMVELGIVPSTGTPEPQENPFRAD